MQPPCARTGGGDQAKADTVYEGVVEPLVAHDVADAIAFVATRPRHVNIDRLTVKPVAQAGPGRLHRGPLQSR